MPALALRWAFALLAGTPAVADQTCSGVPYDSDVDQAHPKNTLHYAKAVVARLAYVEAGCAAGFRRTGGESVYQCVDGLR